MSKRIESMLIPIRQKIVPKDVEMMHTTRLNGRIISFSFVRSIHLAFGISMTVSIKVITSKSMDDFEIFSDDKDIIIKSKEVFNDLKTEYKNIRKFK